MKIVYVVLYLVATAFLFHDSSFQGEWTCYQIRSWGRYSNSHLSDWSMVLNNRGKFHTQYPFSRDTGSYSIRNDSLILHYKYSLGNDDVVFKCHFVSPDTLILDAGEYRDASIYYMIRKK